MPARDGDADSLAALVRRLLDEADRADARRALDGPAAGTHWPGELAPPATPPTPPTTTTAAGDDRGT